MAKFCSECGAALSGSGRFCSECGATTGNASVATASPPQVVPPPAGIMDQLLDRRNLRNIALEDYGDYDVAMEYISLARKMGYKPERWRYPSHWDLTEPQIQTIIQESYVAKDYIQSKLPEGYTVGWVEGWGDWIYPIGFDFDTQYTLL